MASIPFLLPHEMLEVIAQTNPEKMEAFVAANIQEPQLKATATDWAAMCGTDMNMIIVLGLHGDGVPFAAKMRDSLEQLSWSLDADPSAPRILFTTIPKSAMVGRKSWDAVLQVFCMEHATAGTGQMAYIEAHRGGLGQHRQGQVQNRCSGG